MLTERKQGIPMEGNTMALRYNAFPMLAVVDDTDIAGMVSRLETIFLSGTPALVAAGTQWYADRTRECNDLANLAGLPVDVVAYVVSALSPQTQWGLNYSAAMSMIAAWSRGEDKPRTATLYAANDTKAWRMLNECAYIVDEGKRNARLREILGKGPKTHAFARNLQGIGQLAVTGALAVTVDSITYQAAAGTVFPRGIRGKRYARVAGALDFLARKYGVPAYVFQAVVWTVYRGTGA